MPREYERTHPFITFALDLGHASYTTWLHLGEAASKSEHVSRSLLRPEVAAELLQVFLIKGAAATTAIEGNTLTEDEVREVIEGRRELPPSKEYLGQEVRNVVNACNVIRDDVLDAVRDHGGGDPAALSPSTIAKYNRMVLDGLELEPGVTAGEVRDYSVTVGGVYRGAPAADCTVLLERLCRWLNSSDFDAPQDHPELAWPLAIVKAAIAHLYLAWIHPFGDGNGRTARLLEVHILLADGFPQPTAQLMSNHYNATRADYYRRLGEASRDKTSLGFVAYAVRGFVDELRAQLDRIWAMQYEDRWEQYVYQRFGPLSTESKRRQLRLVKDLSRSSIKTTLGGLPTIEPIPRNRLRLLSPELALMYATKTDKTLTRDINAVVKMGLVIRRREGLLPASNVVLGFAPESRAGRGPNVPGS